MRGTWFKLCYTFVLLLLLHMNHHSLGLNTSGVGNNIRCIERERQVLMAFKHGVVDTKKSKNRLLSWGTLTRNRDCCTWEGVYCSNHTGHVIELDLGHQSLQGMISPKLVELQHLKLLNLSHNNFSQGEISKINIGSLTNLRYLDLSWANLGGKTPYYQLGNLTNLQYLDLGRNSFANHVESFNWLPYLFSLQYLDLSLNCLSGSIPDVSANMSSLAYLDLSYNHLGGRIPRSFAKLCNLQSLNIAHNNLSGQFSEVVELLSTCAQNSLEILILRDNHLAGSLPNLTNFASLDHLDLSNNRLSGRIPESIGQMSNLGALDLGMNSLDGVISETHFSNLSNLILLDLSLNPLVLNFHSDWVPPFQLIFVILGSCKMGPHFPNWLRTQKNYFSLDISNAEISDMLPHWFWGLAREADFINLSHNKIRGTFETLTLKFINPPWLNLSSNQLEGSIPSLLLNATALDLSNNKISGSIPSLCSTAKMKLEFLDLSRNNISGVLPNCWTHVKNLNVLDLSNNILHGEIPATMGSLHQIKTLKLNGNRLVGELPSSLKNCKELRVLDLGYNILSGPLPKWLGPVGTHNLVILMLQSNHFTGSMPSQLCNLAQIHILDLSMNNISGTIPKCLNNLATLAQNEDSNPDEFLTPFWFPRSFSSEYRYDNYASFIWKGRRHIFKSTLGLVKRLDLSSNKLSGEIPSEIAHLVGLVSLNLSRNHLTDQILPEIGKLQSLEVLDLSSNHLYGKIPTSLAQIYGLSILDVSNNNLSGKIPIGRQLQTLDPSGFEENPLLCGLPLKLCPSEQTRPEQRVIIEEESKDGLVTQGFYISMGLGFFAGFWGVFGTVLVNRSWRYTYFKFLNDVNDWMYVRIALIRRSRMFRS